MNVDREMRKVIRGSSLSTAAIRVHSPRSPDCALSEKINRAYFVAQRSRMILTDVVRLKAKSMKSSQNISCAV